VHCSISIDSIGWMQIRLSTGSEKCLSSFLCINCDINNLLIYNNTSKLLFVNLCTTNGKTRVSNFFP
jgi:hypothetical protein